MTTTGVMLAKGGKFLLVPYRADLAAIIPHHRTLEHQGQRLILMPNTHFEAKLARNLGIDVPSPILTNYDWAGTTPWEIQKTTAAMMVEHPRLYVLNSMGTGKSLSALLALNYLLSNDLIERALIIAPLSTLTPVWEAEIFRFMPHLKRITLHGSRKDRLEGLRRNAQIYIINHHGVPLMAKELAARDFGAIVIDELAVLRNRRTKLWEGTRTAIAGAKWVWGMTGSPTPMSPMDAWAQVRLLTPDRVPGSATGFKHLTMSQVSQFRWVPRADATTVVHQAMQPAVRFTRDDVMELPETTYVDRQVALDQIVVDAYKTMVNKLRMIVANGEEVNAANEGVLHSKLLQIAMGWVYTGANKIYQLPSQARLDALTEVVSENDRKTIVFVPFVHALNGVAAHLTQEGFDTAVIHGGVPRHARDKIFANFQHAATPRVLVAHPRTMAHGLTLTAANTIVWYAPYPDLEIYEQANARITRPGQKAKTLIVHLHGGMKVETSTYRRLRERAKMQGVLLDLFAGQDVAY